MRAALVPTKRKSAVVVTLIADLVASPLVKIGKAAQELVDEDRRNRVDGFARCLRAGEPADLGEATLEDALFPQIAKAMIDDEESGKEWAYAGLVKAFATDRVPIEHRMRFVRCIRDSLLADLIRFLDTEHTTQVSIDLGAITGSTGARSMLTAMQRWTILPAKGSAFREGESHLHTIMLAVLKEAWAVKNAADRE